MISQGSNGNNDQPFFSRLWGSGFLPSQHQGVRLRTGGDPVLYLSNPPGIDRQAPPRYARRRRPNSTASPPSHSAIRRSTPASPSTKWPSACRPPCRSLTDLSDEPKHALNMYGIDENGAAAASPATACWRGAWSSAACGSSSSSIAAGTSTAACPTQIRGQCHDVDQAAAALVKDLKQRGLLDDTLVIWGGEFGRTVYSQGGLTEDNYGRDHHGRCFTLWLAGGGIKPGITYGETDDYCYNIVRNPVHVHDLNATILHCLGIDHERLTYRFQGRDYRLTDVAGKVVRDILADAS